MIQCVPSSSLVASKTRRVEGLMHAKSAVARRGLPSRGRGVVVWRGVPSSGVVFVTRLWFKTTRSVTNSPLSALVAVVA
ncbi:hypothetical protein TNCV_3902881 [Trichonephila clavipes]|nr:hypothetical protein TNCV_3902881 [Trichonephila clavipes]